MTESSSDDSAQQGAKPSVAMSEIAGLEKKFLRLTFWQTILSVAGVFTGAVALYAALTESQAVRQQTSATVWPYVQYMVNDTSVGDTASFALSFDNVGVGPARMQSVLITHNGEPVRDWESLTARLLPEGAQVGVDYGKTSINRRVLAPGETVTAIQTMEPELARAVQAAVYSGNFQLSYCYCSIFDECWSANSSVDVGSETNQPIEGQCPNYGDKGFID